MPRKLTEKQISALAKRAGQLSRSIALQKDAQSEAAKTAQAEIDADQSELNRLLEQVRTGLADEVDEPLPLGGGDA